MVIKKNRYGRKKQKRKIREKDCFGLVGFMAYQHL